MVHGQDYTALEAALARAWELQEADKLQEVDQDEVVQEAEKVHDHEHAPYATTIIQYSVLAFVPSAVK